MLMLTEKDKYNWQKKTTQLLYRRKRPAALAKCPSGINKKNNRAPGEDKQ